MDESLLERIRPLFPNELSEMRSYDPYMLREYLQCLILDFLSRQKEAGKMVFIGGTCLRIIHGINRFSEDLDFDCKGLSIDEFKGLTDRIISYLRDCGSNALAKEKESEHLTAYRRSILVPQLLFELKLSGYRNQRFLIKIEAQDQGIGYEPQVTIVNRCGFLFPIQVAPLDVLCAMKVSTVLARGKGRDFYDLIFLLQRTMPSFDYLQSRYGITDKKSLKEELFKCVDMADLATRSRDFQHLLIKGQDADRILHFRQFVESL